MHCPQARSRLIEHEKSGTDPRHDRQLVEHFQDCPACAEEAEASGLLTRLLRTAGEDDTTDLTPMAVARLKIEAREAAIKDRRTPWQRIVDALTRTGPFRIPRVVYTGAAVGLVMLLSVIPFRYHQTVGYAVAFAGVETELVEDNEIFCDMLYELGLFEADVAVLSCDTTCHVQVIALKSLEEAQMVVSAFDQVKCTGCSSDIIPVRIDKSGSLLERAGRDIL